ncbi:GFA family protein [Amorphus coralli]|uniref:GFA family protein n=1 Tax=Amorphus coralli TaxID=340680 RepID=UPI0003717C6B|nr:GFA family protein [Amorphus coralli]
MSMTYSGGCACGAVRYETASAPIFQNHCQCRDCQHASGTGHASYLTFPDRSFVTISGKVITWTTIADSGHEKTHAFCPVCGSPVYLTLAVMPDVLAVHAASLDDPGRFQPEAVTYAGRGLPWDTLDPSLQTFETVPPR